MDNPTFLSLSGEAAIQGMVIEALDGDTASIALLNDWTTPTFDPSVPSITYVSQAFSTSSLVGQYVGSMTFPYLKRDLDTIFPIPLVYRDPYPTTFVKLQTYFLDYYGVQLDDGEFAIAGTTTPLSGTDAIDIAPDATTGWVTLVALEASIRFTEGSTFKVLPINASVPTPMARLFTLDGDIRVATLTDHFDTPPPIVLTPAQSVYEKLTAAGAYFDLHEASGPRADALGNFQLTIVGSITTDEGPRGSGDVAMAQTASGYASCAVPANSNLDVPNGATGCCLFGWSWFSNSSTLAYLAAIGSGTAKLSSYVYNGNVVAFQGGVTAYQPAPTASAWHFYVTWIDPADGLIRLSVDNGPTVVSSTAPTPPAVGDTYFAVASLDGTYEMFPSRSSRWGYIRGGILTADERTWLYNSGSGRDFAEIMTLSEG